MPPRKTAHVPSDYPKLAPRYSSVYAPRADKDAEGRSADWEAHSARVAAQRARVQHRPPGTKGPYVSPPRDASTDERIAIVVAHYEGLPCPGCKDAVALLNEYRVLNAMNGPIIPPQFNQSGPVPSEVPDAEDSDEDDLPFS